MLLSKNKNFFLKRAFLVVFFIAFVAAGIFVADHLVFAQTVTEAPTTEQAAGVAGIESGELRGNIFADALKWILYQLIRIFLGFINVAASVFAWATRPEYISGPTGLLNLEVVYTLWKFIRDFFNLGFIFLLLFSAFGTVFQLHQFNLKKNFFSIIAAALLINFSFPITRIVIDAGNVPMYFFAKGLAGDASTAQGNAYADVTLGFFKNSGLSDILDPVGGSSANFFQLITGVIFSFMFMITLFTLAILFIFRLIKLVILLIFSPLGIAASLIPGLEKHGKEWWSNLFQTVFFGPAAMLMLVIALRFITEINGSSFSQGLADQASGNAASLSRTNGIVAQGIFFIPIILMWMAMGVGNKFGIEGAAMVMGQANKVLDWGKKAALWAPNKAWGGVKAGAAGTGSFAWRKANAKMSKKYGWSPTALKEAWKKSREHSKGQDMQDIEQATADRTDTFNAASSRIANTVNPFSKHRGKWGIGKNTDHTDEGFAHFQGQVNKNAKHVSEVSSDTRQLLEHLGHAIETEDAADTVAHLRAVAKNNDFNDLVDTMGKDMVEKNFDFKIVGDSYTKDVVDADGKTIQMKFVNKEGEVNGTKLKLTYAVTDDGTEHLQTDSESVKATIAGALKTANVNEDLQNKTMLDLGTIAMSNTHYGYGGMATRNDDGKYVITTAAEQAEYNAGKLETEGGQKISTSIHEGTLYSHVSIGQGKNAKQFLTGLNGEVAKAVISALPDDFQATRARTRVKSYTLATQNLEEVRTAMGKKGNEGYAKAVADIRAAQKKAKDEAEKLSTTSAAANDA